MPVIENLTFTYGKRNILDTFCYTFGKTGLYVLMGESGTGKTTLLRLIAGLLTPTAGSVSDFGKLAFSFQEYRLFDGLTALQNVQAAACKGEETGQGAAMLAALGLLPEDAKRKPSALSGGQKQRVSLARALAYPCDTVLLDEPVKELDPETAKRAWEVIREASKDRLIIATSHVEVADAVLIKL